MKDFTTTLAVVLLSVAAIGCDTVAEESEPTSINIYNEGEMAKYRQSPEELRAYVVEAQEDQPDFDYEFYREK